MRPILLKFVRAAAHKSSESTDVTRSASPTG